MHLVWYHLPALHPRHVPPAHYLLYHQPEQRQLGNQGSPCQEVEAEMEAERKAAEEAAKQKKANR